MGYNTVKMHKLVGHEAITYCSVWLGGGGFEEFLGTRWWKHTTCKRCLKHRKR
jgi:hypothetical protein